MPSVDITWSGSLHQTFRLLPKGKQSANLRPFLEADRLTPDDLLKLLPYDKARAKDPAKTAPDPKRYRDGRQVYQTVGLLYEDAGLVRVTDLGKATLRWLDIITEKNRVILARHAAYALAACQLRNPTGAGERYAANMTVFPFAFIWRAMLALEGRISSDELNRSIFKVQNEAQLSMAIENIRKARDANDVSLLGDETITGDAKNDRIIPWVSLASFGWTLFADKGNDTHYKLDPATHYVVREAARIRHPHKEFSSVRAYIEHVSRCAALPKDSR
ncbi:hypothetical protein [uncultured Pseudacidovorax sp.]|uniref:hypothetical protein n=1 Tax=uncultured Pseudacidovorax sp. TaxID=679313 RepID=UPI0025D7BF72|nr:hypothetical protein [uncultured Pseudacidovorax sp.]